MSIEDKKIAFTFILNDISTAIDKYNIIFIKRQNKLLHLCKNYIDKLNKSRTILNNKYKTLSYFSNYDKSRYITLIKKEYYDNLFKKYFIPILLLINENNIENINNDLNKIAKLLNFIGDNKEMSEKITNDIVTLSNYITDDKVDNEKLENNILENLGKLNHYIFKNKDEDEDVAIIRLETNLNKIKYDVNNYNNDNNIIKIHDILKATFKNDINIIIKDIKNDNNFYTSDVDYEMSKYIKNIEKLLLLKDYKIDGDNDEINICIKEYNDLIQNIKNSKDVTDDNNNIEKNLNEALIIEKKILVDKLKYKYYDNIKKIDKFKDNIFEIINNIDKNIEKIKIKKSTLIEDPEQKSTEAQTGGNYSNNIINNNKKIANLKRTKYNVCGYVTDIEGNMDYFNKYVKISKILEWTNNNKNILRFKKKNSIFVYGGDTQDKGNADIRFVNILLKFKEDYPDRVIFIIGNRDANKLRIPSELFEKYNNENLFLKKYDNYPYWIDSNKRITLRKYLKDNNYELNIKNRLKYIIEYTLGFKDGFEKRRTELSIILKKNISKITDTDVISSFLNSVMPFPENIELSNDNYMLKYLKQGQIAYIFGEYIFVHGAINKYNIGKIPQNNNRIDDINIWINELNSWFQKELSKYINNPTIGGITKKRKAYNIIDYVIPKNKSISVVYANNLKNGNGKHINKNVSKILNKYGIKNIITGHKPHGDCPLVIRNKYITAISADTSYSNANYLKEKNKIDGDNRGNAVCEVLLYSNGYIRIHGKYANNSKYSYILKKKVNNKIIELNDYIGMQLNNKYWVKNINNINKKLLISYGKDYELYDKWISLKEVNDLLK
jgi:hypothetical protein